MNNIFSQIDPNKNQELFDILLQDKHIKIERIVSTGQASPKSGWYDQAFNEWVIVLKGDAIIVFENSDAVKLKPGDYLNIPAFTKHKVTWTSLEIETVWLAVFY